jgi:hypothetical protein
MSKGQHARDGRGNIHELDGDVRGQPVHRGWRMTVYCLTFELCRDTPLVESRLISIAISQS